MLAAFDEGVSAAKEYVRLHIRPIESLSRESALKRAFAYLRAHWTSHISVGLLAKGKARLGHQPVGSKFCIVRVQSRLDVHQRRYMWRRGSLSAQSCFGVGLAGFRICRRGRSEPQVLRRFRPTCPHSVGLVQGSAVGSDWVCPKISWFRRRH